MRGADRRGVIIGELACAGQADENAFRSPIGLKTEGRSPIVEQVEFHIASPAVELKIFIGFAIGGILSFFHQGKIGGNEGFRKGLHHIKILLDISAVVVIEKNASNAPPLPVAVLVGEIAGAAL